MELVSTMEISGEEREIADAYAREQIDGINTSVSSISQDIAALDAQIAVEHSYTQSVESNLSTEITKLKERISVLESK